LNKSKERDMTTPITFINKGNNTCSNCGKKLKSNQTIWLELSTTDGLVYDPSEFPKDHQSQGMFEFGSDCATQVVSRV